MNRTTALPNTVLQVFCAAVVCFSASALPQQEPSSKSDTQPVIQTGPSSSEEYEVKVNLGSGIEVRRKGTEKWTPSLKLSEPIAVGLLDHDHKIYVVTRAVKPLKWKHMPDPDYPESEKKLGREGKVFLHIVVDDQGLVRSPVVDESTSSAFAQQAVKAVQKWKFEPAKLNGYAVAVLINVEVTFRLN